MSTLCIGYANPNAEACMCDKQRDSLALVAFYDATNGPTWVPQFVWDLSQPIGTWSGIGLNAEGCVESIDLDGSKIPVTGYQVSGTLPAEIGMLSELKQLILSENFVGGNIPSEIGQLSNLETLRLDNNAFTGAIPPTIEGLGLLTQMDISVNNLSGSIPITIRRVQRLQVLNLSHNNLSGEIPATIGDLLFMEECYLNQNNLSGSIPATIGMLTRLEALNLSNNMLSGCYPPGMNIHCAFANASNNPELPWQGNINPFCNGESTEGAPCDDGSTMTSLDMIDDNCMCAGTNFVSCRERDSLILVEIYDATLGEQWTRSWDLNTPMDSWYGVRLSGDGCVEELDLDGTEDFTISNTGNNMSREFPLLFSNLRNLKTLIIGGNPALSGSIPSQLGELESLETLIISGNESITGPVPIDILSMKSLVQLDLSSNAMTGGIPNAISNLTSVKFLNLSNNDLGGVIPAELGLLSELEVLDLSSTGLFGEISGNLGALTELTILNLTNNSLTGCIPDDFLNLCYLTTDDLGVCMPSVECQYDLSGNPKLPFMGDLLQICNGESQVGAPCDDLTATTERDTISINCQCRGAPLPELSCRERDSLVLVSIHESTNGIDWITPWDLSEPINIWNGVSLNDKECVESLDLSNNNLTDTLPQSISQLSELKVLDLNNNILNGTLTKEIRSLSNLEVLDLSFNNYGGEIPIGYYSLSSIKILNLSNNQITGVVNILLTQLSRLETLNLGNNDLAGCLDDKLLEMCNRAVDMSGNGNLPWQGDFTKFCEGIDQIGAPCQDKFDTTIEDKISALCECTGICIKPNAGLDTVATICHGESLDLTPFITGENTGSFLAQGGNGLVDVGGLLTEDFYRVGANRIAYQVMGELGDCRTSDQALIDVTVLQSPYFDFVGDTIVCDDGTTNLTVSWDGPLTYEWSDGSTDEGLFIDESGTYSLTVTSEDNQCAASNTVDVAIVPTYTIDIIGSASLCPGDVYFIQVDTNEEYIYEWSTGSTSMSIEPESPGTFSVTVTDTNGCTASDDIVLQDLEEASIVFTDINAICLGDTASLGIVNGTFEKYTWSNGETSPQIEITTPNTYSVTVENGEGCEGIASIEIGGIDPFNVALDGPLAVCNDQSYTISLAAGTYESYSWSTGAESPTIEIDSPDIYFVTVTDISGCTAIASLEVESAEPFDIEVVGPNLICRADSTILALQGGPYNDYKWSTADIDSMITVTTAGEYFVTVTNDQGCAATDAITIAYFDQDEVEIMGPTVVCEGDPFTLSVESTFLNYIWSTGSEESFVEASEIGTYSVTVTDDNNCDIIDSTQVTLPEGLNIQFTEVNTICAGDTISLGITNGTFETYLWSTGETTPEIRVDTPDTYSVTIEDDMGCEASASIELSGLDALSISLDGPAQVCNDQSYTVSVTSGSFESYTWSTGAESSTIDIDSPGNYFVMVTDANGCTAISSLEIGLAEPFEIAIEGPMLICRDDIANVRVGGDREFANYAWSTGDQDSTLMIDVAGQYAVTVTDRDGCSSSTSIWVQNFPEVVVEIEGPEVVCGDPFRLLVDGAFQRYLWSTGSEESSIDVVDIGSYAVTATDDNNCDVVDSIMVAMAEIPEARADRFSIPSDVASTSIDVVGNDLLSQDWFIELVDAPSFGDLVQVGSSVFDYTPVEGQPVEDTFTYRLCNVSCPDLCSEVQAQLRLTSVLDDCNNEAAITPNGDGVNDLFVTCIDDLAQRYPENSLVIYNRWGQQLYTASPYDNNWNGLVDGKPLPQSTYYFILRLKNGSSLELGGSILLIR